VYTWCSGDVLKMFNLNDLLSGIVNPTRSNGPTAPYQGANVAVSGNGGYSGADGTNGIVWATYPDGSGGGWLYAYDASNLPASPYSSHLNGLSFQKFTPPVVANGKVYVATASRQVLVYGLGGVNP